MINVDILQHILLNVYFLMCHTSASRCVKCILKTFQTKIIRNEEIVYLKLFWEKGISLHSFLKHLFYRRSFNTHLWLKSKSIMLACIIFCKCVETAERPCKLTHPTDFSIIYFIFMKWQFDWIDIKAFNFYVSKILYITYWM